MYPAINIPTPTEKRSKLFVAVHNCCFDISQFKKRSLVFVSQEDRPARKRIALSTNRFVKTDIRTNVCLRSPIRNLTFNTQISYVE